MSPLLSAVTTAQYTARHSAAKQLAQSSLEAAQSLVSSPRSTQGMWSKKFTERSCRGNRGRRTRHSYGYPVGVSRACSGAGRRYKGFGEVAPPPPPPRIIDSRLVLVRRGSPNVLRFDHWQALQAGGAAPLTCHASHPGNGIGKMYPEERRFQEWRYTESKCVAARDACSVQLVQGKFLKRVDANLVLDVAFWKFHEGTAVNWVGGGSDDRTYLRGGGRDFRVNSDGSICL